MSWDTVRIGVEFIWFSLKRWSWQNSASFHEVEIAARKKVKIDMKLIKLN